jgi:hypothetical protein
VDESTWGCFDHCVGVLVICVLVLVFTVFCIVCTVFLCCFVYVYLFPNCFVCIGVWTTATAGKLNCSNNNNNIDNNNKISNDSFVSKPIQLHVVTSLHVRR